RAVSPHPTLWGGPWSTDLERTVPGRCTEEEWPALLEAIRRASGRVGAATQCGRAFEWTSSSPDGMHVAVTPSGDDLSLRVLAGSGGGGAAFSACLRAPALPLGRAGPAPLPLPLPAGLGGPAAGLATALAGARTAVGRLCALRRRQALAVMRGLEERIGSNSQ